MKKYIDLDTREVKVFRDIVYMKRNIKNLLWHASKTESKLWDKLTKKYKLDTKNYVYGYNIIARKIKKLHKRDNIGKENKK